MIGTAPDTHVARTLGISRRTAQRRRQAAGIPPARKPSPEFDRIVAAVAFLDLGAGVELWRILDHLEPASFALEGQRRVWRVDMRSKACKLVGRRLERVGEGVYRVPVSVTTTEIT